MDNIEKLDATQFPPISKFYNCLSKTHCSASEYNKAQKAWHEFNCSTMRDYMLAYLKLDVHQLADVFENFRTITLNEDAIDAINFFGIPGKIASFFLLISTYTAGLS